MAEKNDYLGRHKTPTGLVVYDNSTTPDKYKEKEKWKITVSFEKSEELSKILDPITQAENKRYGRKNALPVKAEEKEGRIWVHFASNKPPPIVGVDGVTPHEVKKWLPKGSEVKVIADAALNDTAGPKKIGGVMLYLHAVQVLKEGAGKTSFGDESAVLAAASDDFDAPFEVESDDGVSFDDVPDLESPHEQTTRTLEHDSG